MKSIIFLFALVGVASAIRLDLNNNAINNAVDASFEAIQEVGQDVEQYLQAFVGKDRPDKGDTVVILTKFIVSPDEALDFVEAIKKVKESVKDSEGNQLYSLVKTKTDNLTYYTYTVWKSWEDLKEHIKSETVKKFVEYSAKAKIAVFTTPVYVIE